MTPLMRTLRSTRALLVLAMIMLGGMSAAWAQDGDGSGQAPAGTAVEARAPGPAAQPEETDSVMPQPERLMQKPSGFWTSGRPAVGGAYRYRLLGIGTGVMLVTAAMMVWVIRRHPRRNAES
jgi:hypothetical protein